MVAENVDDMGASIGELQLIVAKGDKEGLASVRLYYPAALQVADVCLGLLTQRLETWRGPDASADAVCRLFFGAAVWRFNEVQKMMGRRELKLWSNPNQTLAQALSEMTQREVQRYGQDLKTTAVNREAMEPWVAPLATLHLIAAQGHCGKSDQGERSQKWPYALTVVKRNLELLGRRLRVWQPHEGFTLPQQDPLCKMFLKEAIRPLPDYLEREDLLRTPFV